MVNMKKWAVALVLGWPLWLTGCGSMPAVYHPQAVGPVSQGQAHAGLLLKLTSDVCTVPVGQPVNFQLLVRNISTQSFWIPVKPQQGFFWTYSNGRHDFIVFDREQKKYYTKNECLLLQPGKELVLTGSVDTYYFEKLGITEFIAELVVAQNTNPELQPFWSGRALSNAYGIRIEPSQKGQVAAPPKSDRTHLTCQHTPAGAHL